MYRGFPHHAEISDRRVRKDITSRANQGWKEFAERQGKICHRPRKEIDPRITAGWPRSWGSPAPPSSSAWTSWDHVEVIKWCRKVFKKVFKEEEGARQHHLKGRAG